MIIHYYHSPNFNYRCIQLYIIKYMCIYMCVCAYGCGLHRFTVPILWMICPSFVCVPLTQMWPWWCFLKQKTKLKTSEHLYNLWNAETKPVCEIPSQDRCFAVKGCKANGTGGIYQNLSFHSICPSPPVTLTLELLSAFPPRSKKCSEKSIVANPRDVSFICSFTPNQFGNLGQTS